MSNIRIKTGNPNLPAARIDSHKDFDQVLQQFHAGGGSGGASGGATGGISTKFLLFTGGIITGAAITALVMSQYIPGTTTVETSSLTPIEVSKELPVSDEPNTEASIVAAPEQTTETNTTTQEVPTHASETLSEVTTDLGISTDITATNTSVESIVTPSVTQEEQPVLASAIETSEVSTTNEVVEPSMEETTIEPEVSQAISEVLDTTTAETLATADQVQDSPIASDQGSNVDTTSTPDESTLVELTDSTISDMVAEVDEDFIILENDTQESLITFSNPDPLPNTGKEGQLFAGNDASKSEPSKKSRKKNRKGRKEATSEELITSSTGDSTKQSKTSLTAIADTLNQAGTQFINSLNTDSSRQVFKKVESKIQTWTDRLLSKRGIDNDASKDDRSGSIKDSTQLINREAQVSFVTPLSSNGTDGDKYTHNFSLNILQGYNGGLNGVEIGGLINVERKYVRGVQLAGLSNFNGGDVNGVQGAGLTNLSGGTLTGVQAAGLLNASQEVVAGGQFAGLANLAIGKVHGAQAAGLLNIATGNLLGFQAAGLLNVASSTESSNGFQAAGLANFSNGAVHGFQAAGLVNFMRGKAITTQISGGINIGRDITGAQIGLINIGRDVTGTQIGLINIARKVHGAPIGLISIVSQGRFDVDVWGSDALQANIGIKTGSESFYNIYAFGINPFESGPRTMGAGMGFGGHVPIKKWFFNPEAIAWQIIEDVPTTFDGINLLNQGRLMLGREFSDKFSVYAGPVINVHVYDLMYRPIQSESLNEFRGNQTNVDLWVGWSLGIQLF